MAPPDDADEPGAEVIYGVHPVTELLESRAQDVERVFVVRGRHAKLGRLLRAARERGIPVSHLEKEVLVRKVTAVLGKDLTGSRLAVWGLAFKPETDDMREAAAIRIVEGLLAAGASVAVHDPVAMDVAREWHFGDRVDYAADAYKACTDADALLIVTEWLQYRRPDWPAVASELKTPVVFDGRNLFSPERMRDYGFTYYPIGRKQAT